MARIATLSRPRRARSSVSTHPISDAIRVEHGLAEAADVVAGSRWLRQTLQLAVRHGAHHDVDREQYSFNAHDDIDGPHVKDADSVAGNSVGSSLLKSTA